MLQPFDVTYLGYRPIRIHYSRCSSKRRVKYWDIARMDLFEKDEQKLKKIEANKHLHYCISIIYYMGLWPEKAKHKFLYNLYRSCTWFCLFGVLLISEIAYIIVNFENLDSITAGATILMTNSTFGAKVIYIIYRHKRIKNLIDITNSEMFNRDNDKYERIITRYSWQGIFHHTIYQSFAGIAVISWGYMPVRNVFDGSSNSSKELPTTGWYPYNIESTPGFAITCMHQFVVCILSCINNVAIDSLITGLIITACCQLKLLNCNISEIQCIAKDELVSNDNVNVKKSNILKVYNDTYASLKHCVEHSKMIFDFSMQIQDMFGTLIFFQLLMNCITICLIAFNVSQMKEYVPIDLLGMLMYMCCMSYQVFTFCWHGNELHLHSLNICFSAYTNNWWQNSKHFKQAIIILMTRAQWPITLTVGTVMELSLQNFVSLLRTSYSIFAVLRTTTAT